MATQLCSTCKEFPALYYCNDTYEVSFQGACHFLDHIEICNHKHLPYIVETPDEPSPETPIVSDNILETGSIIQDLSADEEIEIAPGAYDEILTQFDEFGERVNEALNSCIEEERQKLKQLLGTLENPTNSEEIKLLQQPEISEFLSHYIEIFTKSEAQILQNFKFNINFLDSTLSQRKPLTKVAEELKFELETYKEQTAQMREQISMLNIDLQAKEDVLFSYRAIPTDDLESSIFYSPSYNSFRHGIDLHPSIMRSRSPVPTNISYDSTSLMQRHRSTVYSVIITSDNRFVISASADKTIRVWNMAKSNLEMLFKEHTKAVRDLCITKDDRYVISASFDKTIRIYDLETQSQVCVLEGHTGEVNCVNLTHDDKYIISSSNDGSTLIWNFESKTFLSIIHEYSKVLSQAISKDDKYLFSGCYDHKITVWNLQEMSEEASMVGHTGCIFSLVVNNSNTYLYSGSEDNSIRIWKLEDWTIESILYGHSDCVWSLDIDTTDRYLVSGSYDKTVRVWDVFERTQQAVLKGHGGGVLSVVISDESRLIISGSSDKTVKAWRLSDGSGL
jgi:WD40 repeat protein